LLANLVNCGMKIFITTHSDYILRELNNLILLNGDSPHLAKIAKDEGYSKMELIKGGNIKIYSAEESLTKLPSNTKKSKVRTLVEVHVDDENGILASDFDDAINDMNRIADDIAFGG